MKTRNQCITPRTTSEDILFAIVILCIASSLLLSLGSVPL